MTVTYIRVRVAPKVERFVPLLRDGPLNGANLHQNRFIRFRVGWLVVGWLVFNGTFSTKRLYRAMQKLKVC